MNSKISVSNILLFCVCSILVSNLPAYFLSLRIGVVPWHFWAASCVACAFLAVFTSKSLKLSRPAMRYVVWYGCFVAVCLLSLLVIDRGENAIEQFIQYFWNFAIGATFLLLVREPGQVRACGYGVVAAVILLAILTMMEFANPEFQVLVDRYFDEQNKVGELNRAAALYGNPNNNGAAMVLGMFIGQFFLSKPLRFPFAIFVGAAVFCTVSRSSLTLWAAAVLLSFTFSFTGTKILSKILSVVTVIVLGSLLASGAIPGILTSLGLDELMSRSMMERLSGNFFSQGDGSSQARLGAALDAARLFFDNPVFGVGLGNSASVEGGIGAHNQHLKIASEVGAVGYLVWSAMLVIAVITKSVPSICFILLYFFVGLFSHTMFSFSAYAVLLPIALALLPDYVRGGKKQQGSRKRRRRKRRSVTRPEGSQEKIVEVG